MSNLTVESTAVQSYLNILQAIINRMATNSANCKTWCVTLVSAILVIIADKGKADYIWITLIPVLLFFFLDAYYLGLERDFRSLYNTFIRNIHTGNVSVDEVFTISVDGSFTHTASLVASSMLSLSIFPFYTLLLVMLVVARFKVF